MFRKIFKFLFTLSLIGFFLALAGYLGAKYYFTATASQKAHQLIDMAHVDHPDTHDDEVIVIAKKIHERFHQTEPNQYPALRLRPYVSNKRLPDWLRYQDGIIETHIEAGLCDNAARMLKFLLAQRGYESVQWNMVTDLTAHSALLVTMPDERKVFIDPYIGLAAYRNESLISPEEMLENIHSRIALDDTIIKFSDKTDTEFYDSFASVRMAAQGHPLIITATLPRPENKPILIGKKDNRSGDVGHEAGQHHMTSFWDYMGHKYNREWVRVLKAPQDMRLEITLLETAEDGIITATPRPQILGKTLTWQLKSGDEITFKDDLAKINWSRLNSYIGVDQIAIYPD